MEMPRRGLALGKRGRGRAEGELLLPADFEQRQTLLLFLIIIITTTDLL